MKRRIIVGMCALVLAAALGAAAQKEGNWTGWVTDTHCGAKGDNEGHAACCKKCVESLNAKYALYDPTSKKVYTLEPQDKAKNLAGKFVKVSGTVSGETITVKSIEATAPPKSK
jgi:hypothetical protein